MREKHDFRLRRKTMEIPAEKLMEIIMEMAPEEVIKTIENRFDIMDYCENEKLSDALDMAIEALEKQVPKEGIGTYTNYKCAVCGRRLRSGKGSSSYGRRDNFCQRCGQKILWRD